MVKTASTMLPIGTKAPDFLLPNIDGKMISLSDYRDKKALLIVFMCNHCPFVKHVAPELVRVYNDYEPKGLGFIGISSNDIATHPDDSPALMKVEAEHQGYKFAYLYDENQDVAQAYRAACTPDFFLFDRQRFLVYRGQLDDSRPKNGLPLTGKDLRAAIDAALAGTAIPEPQKPSIGCNIKWKAGQEPNYFDPKGVS